MKKPTAERDVWLDTQTNWKANWQKPESRGDGRGRGRIGDSFFRVRNDREAKNPLSFFPASQDRGHDTRAAVAVHDGDHPQRLSSGA